MHSLQIWGHSLPVFWMEIYNSKFKYICLPNMCSYWIWNCIPCLPVEQLSPHWNKRSFKWHFWIEEYLWKLFTWEGSQLLHTILWMSFPDHRFCFLMECFICNWCTAIHYHRYGNVSHSGGPSNCWAATDTTLLPCHQPTHQSNALARLAGQNLLHSFWVSTWIILTSANFFMCSSINWAIHKMSWFLLCPY